MRIGLKSCFCIFLVGIIFLASLAIDSAHIDSMMHLNGLTLFLIGVIGFALALFCNWFMSMNHRSDFFIALSFNKTGAPERTYFVDLPRLQVALVASKILPFWELSRSVRRIIVLLGCVFLCFVTINNRTIELFRSIPEKMKASTAEFCPEDLEKEESKSSTAVSPGCQLVLRAYDLGYADSLGDCSPKEEELNATICKLRQHDEPFLHYTWRRLAQFYDNNKSVFNQEFVSEQREIFSKQVENAEDLLASQMMSMQGQARASHHLFTNLPHPEGRLKRLWNEVLNPNFCVEEYSQMSPELVLKEADDATLSRKLSYSYGQLLFNAANQPAAGYCRDFKIHWNTPPTVCEDLSSTPLETLDQFGIKKEVKVVIERLRLKNRLEVLESQKSDGKKKSILPSQEQVDSQGKILARAISFQCFIFKPESSYEISENQVTVDGVKLVATNLEVGESVHSSRMRLPTPFLKNTSALLAPGFSYGGFSSNQEYFLEPDQNAARFFEGGNEFMLTKLGILSETDLMLGHSWLHQRAELLQIYPWFLHLDHFVKLFRKKWRPIRGRL